MAELSNAEQRKLIKWDAKQAMWVNKKTGARQDPPKPSWAERSGGVIDRARFIRAWNAATVVEDVQKKFFWRTRGEITRQKGTISRWLEDQRIYPLKGLNTLAQDRKKWAKQLKQMIEDGELVAMPDRSKGSSAKQ